MLFIARLDIVAGNGIESLEMAFVTLAYVAHHCYRFNPCNRFDVPEFEQPVQRKEMVWKPKQEKQIARQCTHEFEVF